MRPMRPFKSIRVRKLRIPSPHGGIPALLLSPVDAPSNATGVCGCTAAAMPSG